MAPSDLLIATHNPGKIRELTQLLAGVSVRLVSLADLGVTLEVTEDGETFTENAIAKAEGYSRLAVLASARTLGDAEHKDFLTLADDSGLEVDALGGEPGVRSARYGGPDLSDEQRCDLVLQRIAKTPWIERTARFVCVLALARNGQFVQTFEARAEGVIAMEPRGSGGFGFDPIFYYPPLDRTFAELSTREKDEVSHRGLALRKVREFLRSGQP